MALHARAGRQREDQRRIADRAGVDRAGVERFGQRRGGREFRPLDVVAQALEPAGGFEQRAQAALLVAGLRDGARLRAAVAMRQRQAPRRRRARGRRTGGAMRWMESWVLHGEQAMGSVNEAALDEAHRLRVHAGDERAQAVGGQHGGLPRPAARRSVRHSRSSSDQPALPAHGCARSQPSRSAISVRAGRVGRCRRSATKRVPRGSRSRRRNRRHGAAACASAAQAAR